MQALVDWLMKANEELDKLDGRTVHRSVFRGGRDQEIEEITDKVAYKLGERIRREGLQ